MKSKSFRIEVYKDNKIDLYTQPTENKVRIHYAESVRPISIQTRDLIFMRTN